MREFLRVEATRDPDVIDRFKAARARAKTDHRPRIRGMFDRALEVSQMTGWDVESFAETDLDLSPVLDEARTLERRGNPLEARRLYRHLSEVLCDNMPGFSEWESEFRDIFDECNRGAARCAKAGADAARDARLASASTQSASACAEYLRRLRAGGGDPGKARRIAADGARRFPESKKIQSLALSLCPKFGAEYRASLRRMFVLTGSQEHLDELKRRSPLWAADRCDLIRELERRKDLLAAVLHGEGMVDELADTVFSVRWPGVLPRRYHDALATQRHGDRLYAEYKKSVEGAVREGRGGDYRAVGECLRRMRGIPGHEIKLERYVNGLRRRFGLRQALMERLGRIGAGPAARPTPGRPARDGSRTRRR